MRSVRGESSDDSSVVHFISHGDKDHGEDGDERKSGKPESKDKKREHGSLTELFILS